VVHVVEFRTTRSIARLSPHINAACLLACSSPSSQIAVVVVVVVVVVAAAAAVVVVVHHTAIDRAILLFPRRATRTPLRRLAFARRCACVTGRNADDLLLHRPVALVEGPEVVPGEHLDAHFP
jgi:hypothetical protein